MATLRSFSRLTMICPRSPDDVAVSSTMLGDSAFCGSSFCASRVSAAARRPRRRSMSPSAAGRKAIRMITLLQSFVHSDNRILYQEVKSNMTSYLIHKLSNQVTKSDVSFNALSL